MAKIEDFSDFGKIKIFLNLVRIEDFSNFGKN